MALDHAAVRRIALLSRIYVEEDDLLRLQNEINGILSWIDQLNQANVDGIEPHSGAVLIGPGMREDVVTDGGYSVKVLANAPERVGPFFAVPKVIE